MKKIIALIMAMLLALSASALAATGYIVSRSDTKDNGDGTFTVHSYSSERKDPNNKESEIVPVEYERVVRVGEECRGEYSYQKWSYLKGCYNSHYAFSATVVTEKTEPEREDKIRNSLS